MAMKRAEDLFPQSVEDVLFFLLFFGEVSQNSSEMFRCSEKIVFIHICKFSVLKIYLHICDVPHADHVFLFFS